MGEWTLALDESGQFEGSHLEGERDERVGLIVGGVLFPGAPAQVETPWRDALRKACRATDLKFPPHSTDFDDEARANLGALACNLVSEANGRWVAVVQEPSTKQTAEVALVAYVRLLAETVDLAGRLVASDGGSTLHVLPAQRSLKMSLDKAKAALGRGAFTARSSDEDGSGVRALSEATVRDAMDSLVREGSGHLDRRPVLGALEVKSAASPTCHPGVLLADLLCNRVYRTLRKTPSTRLAELLGTLEQEERGACIVAFRGLSRIRALDRALRETPTNLSRAAHVVAELEGDAAAGSSGLSRYQATVQGSAFTARSLWERACKRLASSVPSGTESNLARALAASAELDLAAKSGAYEGTWPALSEGWAGESDLAVRVRDGLEDCEVAARLWRLTLECANHRGDVASGRKAAGEFETITRHHRSVALFAEDLHVQNLKNVMLQNALPAETDDLQGLLDALREAASQLVANVDAAAEFLDVVRAEPDTSETHDQTDTREPALWRALLDRPPQWNAPDRERGRSYGTAARSMAFVGALDEALELAMRARGFFVDSTFDLRFNAAVVARILLERRRLSPQPSDQAALKPALDLAGCQALRTPKRAFEKISEASAQRFLLDLWLRRLLWSRDVDDERQSSWISGLAAAGADSLFSLLSRGELRSHPTELIARHAGELLLKHGEHERAIAWFGLSIEICESSPVGTMRRFALFTKLLADGSEGPSAQLANQGSILAPSFEYR